MPPNDEIDRVCPTCGKVYRARLQRLKHRRDIACSKRCSYDYRRQKKTQPRVSLTCGTCGTQFSRRRANVKGKYGSNFCSRRCHYAGRATGVTRRVVTKPYNITQEGRAAWKAAAQKTVATRRQRDNYVHSDAQRTKLSEAAARQCARAKGALAPSQIELQVAAELTKVGVDFVHQYVFRDTLGRFSFVADFWLPAARAVLEVNGTYWHADPRVYPVPINSMQARCVAKYERKREAYRLLGIRVVEMWEMDLRKSPREAVLRACQELSIGQPAGRVGHD